MPPLDPEMVEPVHDRLRKKGVELCLGDGVAGFEQGEGGNGLRVNTASGKAFPAELVIMVSADTACKEEGLLRIRAWGSAIRGGEVEHTQATGQHASTHTHAQCVPPVLLLINPVHPARLPVSCAPLQSIGVRPEAQLARDAGLELGERGGIRVDEHMRTSDPHVYAVGDAVEVRDWVTGEWTLIPLAGPANRQGRIAANAIMGR